MATFKLKRGQEIEIRFISVFKIVELSDVVRKEYYKKHGEKSPPTYTVTCGGGPVASTWEEIHEYDESSISQAGAEDLVAWQEYQEWKQGLERARWERSIALYLTRGVLAEPPTDNGWIEEQQEDGLTIPSDPRQRKVHWIKTELLTDNDELYALINAIQGQAAEVERAAQLAADMFRDSVG